ncbi:sigma-70 family RNA polymerase sigma factor [Paenibacillus humicola]|uniref:sigma-70 family RNA polymerase sigma factor n=1 Tax=Paenibacillus humicola TaxID=3110540 RepID=UPI00237BD0AB|nr:sigma-70 family RNA polymerase sigma factor [Paenibacillus humicola]
MSQTIPEPFRRLFEQHYPSVARKIHALVGDRAVAEDLAQETFVRLYRSPPDDPGSVGAWLHRVSMRIAYDYMRQRSARQQLTEREQERMAADAHASYPSNEEIAILNWERDVVRRVLQKLSERDRIALMLRQEGYSYEEIAERLGVNAKIVGPLLARAAGRFRKKYGQEEEIAGDIQ